MQDGTGVNISYETIMDMEMDRFMLYRDVYQSVMDEVAQARKKATR